MVFILFFSFIILTAFLTVLQLKLCVDQRFLDIPNQRSSHKKATPSSGGLALSLAFLLAYVSCFLFEPTRTIFWPIFLAVPLAVIGFVDDIRPLSAKLRLIIQVVFALALMVLLDIFSLAAWQCLLFLLGIVWWLNLFNFMDGTDGLAAGEVIFICVALLLLSSDSVLAEHVALATLLACCWGFLFFNWSPAKIFMGDAGSLLLAGLTVILGLSLVLKGVVSVWALLILVAAFASDSTMTLLMRAIRQQALAQAHRSHFYQGLAQKWQGHESVAILYAAVNVCFLLPLAILANKAGSAGLLLCFFAYLPLCLAVIISHRRFLTIQ